MLYNNTQNENNNSNFTKAQMIPHVTRANSSVTRTFGRELTNIGSNLDVGAAKQKISGYTRAHSVNDKMAIETPKVDEQKMMSIEGMEKFDAEHEQDPQCVVPYVKEIMGYVRSQEEYYLCDASYMTKVQKDVNEKMRGILVDWLIDVHLKFKLLPETHYMTVNLIDRYLSQVAVPRTKLQLVGVASMFIAAKYEEIYPPELKDFAYVTDKAYTTAEILDMEGKILCALNFKLTQTSSYRFFERYSKVCGFDDKFQSMGRYLLELCLIEYKIQKYKPSLLACAAVYLTNKLYKREGWSEMMIRNTEYAEQELRTCAKEMCVLLHNSPKSSLQAARRKYSTPKFFEVAKIQLDKI